MYTTDELLNIHHCKNSLDLMKKLDISPSYGTYEFKGTKYKNIEESLNAAQKDFERLGSAEEQIRAKQKKQEENYIILAEQKKWDEVPSSLIEKYAKNIVLTSSIYVSRNEIETEIEVITAECVYGMNVFKDIFAAFSDTFGGRSKTTQKVFRDARKTALNELKREALLIGADAVICVTISYQEVSVSGKSGGMLMAVVTGTAVKLVKK